MPVKGKGPRLWFRPPRGNRVGNWLILDAGGYQLGTGCSEDDRAGAEKALAKYLAAKHQERVASGDPGGNPAKVPVADVLLLLATKGADKQARPKEVLARIDRLLDFWGDKRLEDVNDDNCEAFAKLRKVGAARRELQDLQTAINMHQKRGKYAYVATVTLPKRGASRTRFLEREEAAQLLWSAWKYREMHRGVATDKTPRAHATRFTLVGLYTGTRAGAICAAAFEEIPGYGWIDLERGVFYRKPEGEIETKKRKTPVRLPDRLLAHLRRWRRMGARFVVEWNGKPIKGVDKAFRATARACGMADVTPHTLRHTAATWLMQRGVPTSEAAGYLGMSEEVLRAHYGHHHPRHQELARNAITSHGPMAGQ